MARIEVRSAQAGVESVWVDVDGIADGQVIDARTRLGRYIEEFGPSDAVARTFVELTRECPSANPSDLWQHVTYRNFMHLGHNDQQWKRVSGFALERAFVTAYHVPLERQGITMRIVPRHEVTVLLRSLGILGEVKVSKIDTFLFGETARGWVPFAVAHVKASIAERIQDDVPASIACMRVGLASIMLTMDSKSFPPPHGDGVNHGELGGRLPHTARERPKREYIEVDGQFDALFSYNLRTPPSPASTPSGKRIHTLHFAAATQPDAFVNLVTARWKDRR